MEIQRLAAISSILCASILALMCDLLRSRYMRGFAIIDRPVAPRRLRDLGAKRPPTPEVLAVIDRATKLAGSPPRAGFVPMPKPQPRG